MVSPEGASCREGQNALAPFPLLLPDDQGRFSLLFTARSRLNSLGEKLKLHPLEYFTLRGVHTEPPAIPVTACVLLWALALHLGDGRLPCGRLFLI